MNLLSKINSPDDLKNLSPEQLPQLAGEIRELIIDVVSQNGGHLASNLGVVELTLAIHYVFDTAADKLIFDVGHQCYTHKILTGRRTDFRNIRLKDGPSGFPNPAESSHDSFVAGHASTSISAALGFAVARDISGENHKVVAVAGDGSLTGGLSFEGLNQAGSLGKDILIILNDNNMSISKNVGAISRYLTDIITDESYNRLKAEIWNLTGMLPRKDKLRRGIASIQDMIKGLLVPGQVFEKLGFRYFGPIDGHNIPVLVKTLNQIKNLHGPLFLHVLTKKGKGYKFSEDNPTSFHGIGSFDKLTGETAGLKKSLPYTKVFGETITAMAEKNKSICAITAAMTSGTGLSKFSKKFPERFFDVGIAEQHSVTFAAGLTTAGMKPFFAVYSTFLQRGFDQLIHDVALQRLPAVFCVDRAGLVGEDGPTHHGSFDISSLLQIPGFTVTAPRDGIELQRLLALASEWTKGPFSIRYPRADVPENHIRQNLDKLEYGTWEELRSGKDLAILAVGSMVYPCWKAADMLNKDNIDAAVINCRFLKPIDEKMLIDVFSRFKLVVTVEEGSLIGGFGQYINSLRNSYGFDDVTIKNFGLPDKFIIHGKRQTLLKELEFDVDGIASTILELVTSKKIVSRSLKNYE